MKTKQEILAIYNGLWDLQTEVHTLVKQAYKSHKSIIIIQNYARLDTELDTVLTSLYEEMRTV